VTSLQAASRCGVLLTGWAILCGKQRTADTAACNGEGVLFLCSAVSCTVCMFHCHIFVPLQPTKLKSTYRSPPACPSYTSCIKMSVRSNGGTILTGESRSTQINLFQCRFVYYKSYMYWPGRNPRLPRSEAGDSDPCVTENTLHL
jgi:hypothetical protein